MKIFNTILLLSLCLPVIPGCDLGCKRIPLSAEDNKWFNFATTGDTILFSSSVTQDTFVVTGRYLEWGQCNRLELGDGQKQIGTIYVDRIKNGRPSVSGYSLRFNAGFANDTSSKSLKSFFVLNLETEEHSTFEEFGDTAIFLPTLRRTLKVLRVREQEALVNHINRYPKISEFYWCASLGLVCYKLESGELFYYSEKI